MFFKKKTSDNEYAVLKNEVMRQYNNLQQTNIVNPHMLRDAWGDLCEKAKTAYKFSKKYIDTEGDIDIFTSIRDEAKEKINTICLRLKKLIILAKCWSAKIHMNSMKTKCIM